VKIGEILELQKLSEIVFFFLVHVRMVVSIVVHLQKFVQHVFGVNGVNLVFVPINVMEHKHDIVLVHVLVQKLKLNMTIKHVQQMKPRITKVVLNVLVIPLPVKKYVMFDVL